MVHQVVPHSRYIVAFVMSRGTTTISRSQRGHDASDVSSPLFAAQKVELSIAGWLLHRSGQGGRPKAGCCGLWNPLISAEAIGARS